MGNTIQIERGEGASLERLTVLASSSRQASDLLIFADGVVNAHDLMQHLQDPSKALLPAPDTETSSQPLGPAASGALLNATIRAFALSDAGSTFAPMKPGVELIAHGSAGVDKLYLAAGSTVDATQLGGGDDMLFLRGNWRAHTKTPTDQAFTISDTTRPTQALKVSPGSLGASDGSDWLIFEDGAVKSYDARLAIQNGVPSDLAAITASNASIKTPLIPAELFVV